jgi:hypothetical protein
VTALKASRKPCGGEGEGGGVVALAQLNQRLWIDGAFEVKVQLDLGQAAEPGGDVGFGGRLAARDGTGRHPD